MPIVTEQIIHEDHRSEVFHALQGGGADTGRAVRWSTIERHHGRLQAAFNGGPATTLGRAVSRAAARLGYDGEPAKTAPTTETACAVASA